MKEDPINFPQNESFCNYMHADIPVDKNNPDDGMNFFQGLLSGTLLSLPLWAGIIWAVRQIWHHK